MRQEEYPFTLEAHTSLSSTPAPMCSENEGSRTSEGKLGCRHQKRNELVAGRWKSQRWAALSQLEERQEWNIFCFAVEGSCIKDRETIPFSYKTP